jgi:aquaporin NIP
MIFQHGLMHSCRKSELNRLDNTRRMLLAEFCGTFVMVFAGTGAIVANDFSHGRIGVLGIGLAFGVSVFAMIFLLGAISGAHLNPAVTITLTVARKIPLRLTLFYILCQCAGALVASVLLSFLFSTHPTLGATIPSASATQSFLLEFFLTFLLLFAILITSSRALRSGLIPAVIIGAIIALGAIFGGPISGASMNPARSLAPAIVSGHMDHLWIYLLAPTFGGLTAIPIARTLEHRKQYFSGCSRFFQGI